MQMTFSHLASAAVDLAEASVTFRHPTTRAFGSADLTIPRDSPAFHEDCLSRYGGGLVTITDPAGSNWLGIADVPRDEGNVCRLNVVHAAALADTLPLRSPQVFRGLTAGAIVRHALDTATSGLRRALLRPGYAVEAPPIVPEYTFAGKTLATVLTEMAEHSGQEWQVTATGAVDWTAPAGRWLSGILCDGGNIIELSRERAAAVPVRAVIARDSDGREARAAVSGEAFGRTETVSLGDVGASALGLHAERQLALLRGAGATYRAMARRAVASVSATPARLGWGRFRWGVDPWGSTVFVAATVNELAAVREGDWLRIAAPALGVRGACFTARVAARTITEGSDWFALELVEVPAVSDARLSNAGTPPALAASGVHALTLRQALLQATRQAAASGVPLGPVRRQAGAEGAVRRSGEAGVPFRVRRVG